MLCDTRMSYMSYLGHFSVTLCLVLTAYFALHHMCLHLYYSSVTFCAATALCFASHLCHTCHSCVILVSHFELEWHYALHNMKVTCVFICHSNVTFCAAKTLCFASDVCHTCHTCVILVSYFELQWHYALHNMKVTCVLICVILMSHFMLQWHNALHHMYAIHVILGSS